MAFNFRKFKKGIQLRGETSDPSDNQEGSVWYNSTVSKLKAYINSAIRVFVTEDETQTLENKTIDATSASGNNTITMDSDDVSYDNATSGLTATDVKSAIDELKTGLENQNEADEITYDNITSGLAATDVQAAIDEVDGRVDSIESATYVNSFNSRTGAVTPAASDYDADQIDYDNTTSGLTATDAQAAIDEVEGRLGTAETDISNNSTNITNHIDDTTAAHAGSAISNTPSGNLVATDVQAALNELQSDVDTRATSTDLTNHINDTVDAHDSSAISYNNATSGMTATDAQAAIDEVEGRVGTIEGATYVNSFNSRTGAVTPASSDYDADQIDYDNTTSGLTATDAQAAIDEVEGRLDTAESTISTNTVDISTNASAISDHIADESAAHAGSAISNTPSGNLAATDVQAALNELQSDVDTRATSTELTNHINDTTDAHDASAISYDNTTSGLTADDIQDAIDEIVTLTGTGNDDSSLLENIGISASVATNDLTIAIKQKDGSTDCTSDNPARVGIKTGDGSYAIRSITSSLSATIPSGATMGHRNGIEDYIYVYLLDNSGTLEVAVSTKIHNLETTESSTALSASSDDARVIYSTTARTDVYYALIGKIKITEATAGTWATAPTEVTVGNLSNIRTDSSQTALFADANADITLTSGKLILDLDAISTSYDNANLFRFSNSGTTFTAMYAIQPIQVQITGSIWATDANAQIRAYIDDTTQIQESTRNPAANGLIAFSVTCKLDAGESLNLVLSAGSVRGVANVNYINFNARLSQELE